MTIEARASMFEPEAVTAGSTAHELEHAAARSLAEALEEVQRQRQPGQRERHRRLLAAAIERANRALDMAEREREAALCAESGVAPEPMVEDIARARAILVRAHAANAADALHGAGQLSLSAQRAPTDAACDEGWVRVAAIAAGAAASARVAATLAVAVERAAPGSALARKVQAAAHGAELSACAARKLVDERNHAYTFHTDGGFSFGEGWYLAAAAVLADVAIQIEPGKAGTAAAEAFLCAAGLGPRLTAYRSRPRAMKHTTAIVARAFMADPVSARSKLRAAFLGDEPIPHPIQAWVEHQLAAAPARHVRTQKVLLWIRAGTHQPARNTSYGELVELSRRIERAGLVPVLTGDALRAGDIPAGALDLTLFWQDPLFQGADMRRAQLQFFEQLRQRHGLVGQLGVTTAGMDGPALMGLPTLYLTDAPNVRMRTWVGALPDYREVVRERDYLERITRMLESWAGRRVTCGAAARAAGC